MSGRPRARETRVVPSRSSRWIGPSTRAPPARGRPSVRDGRTAPEMLRRVGTAMLAAALLAASDLRADEPGPVRPFEASSGTVTATQLDFLIMAAQRRHGVEQANPCSDQVFVRRVFL